MNLCIEAAGAIVALALQTFTLSWQHSVEKIEWSESWAVSDAGLVLQEASVEGTGAGMEIPEGSVLRDGAWHYRPGLPPLPELVLSDAGRGADWTLCEPDGRCRQLSEIIPASGAVIRLSPCARDESEP
ncbi:DUF1850 domain-containing protein [Aliihoeflea sp. 40Bstr573]|uniref:DUF1850 domain-containing protein n=1 Tax=Aliihoeflea sp. 40Bstr573 TaxID=2696467 RepID=UPI0020942789|nr:DUF1850 domain-containing protein [Aliihoeflea sp. 40Bstr573]MCO6387014.1 DUF1850 domain-containing protein [Aliihoeflea sp. 40Bstr573]